MPAFRDTLDRFARHYLVALRAETRLSPRAAVDDPPPDSPSASGHSPGVGWVIGLAGCLSFAITAILLRGNPYGAGVAATVATGAMLLLTGARNEVALQRSFAQAGTVALALLLLARVLLLASVGAVAEPAVVATLFAGPVVSRFVPLAVAHWHAGAAAAPGALRTPALWCLPPLVLLVPAGGVQLLVLALLGTAATAFAVHRWQPGASPALQPWSELGFYLGAAVAA